MPSIEEVLEKKYDGLEWRLDGCPTNEEEFVNFFSIRKANGLTEPTWAKIQEHLVTMQADYDSKQYQRDRAKAYPSWQDQLDDIYHNGIDGFKKTIKVIKDKYPK